MTGYEVFQAYIGVKSHFNGSYDFIKYRGITNVSYDSYEKRRDIGFFKFAALKINERDVVAFFVANFVENPNVWIGDLIDNFAQGNATYKEWRIKLNRLYDTYQEDLDNIISFISEKDLDIQEIFRYNTSNYPIIFRFMVEGIIDRETFILLDDVIGFLPSLDEKYKGDIIWDKEIKLINKYRPFIRYDLKRVKGLTNSKLRKSTEA